MPTRGKMCDVDLEGIEWGLWLDLSGSRWDPVTGCYTNGNERSDNINDDELLAKWSTVIVKTVQLFCLLA
jgi:hypothetical protein